MSSFLVSVSAIGAPMPDARVVDEHVEATETVAVGGDHRLDVLLVGHVAGDDLDVVPGAAQFLGGGLDLLRAARRHGQPVALLAEHAGEGEPDPARGTRHDCRPVGHGRVSNH